MSKTIDEKVVQMKFDNGQFEQGVAKSLKTLDTLKFKLKNMDFSRSAADLNNVGKAAKNVDMSGLAQGIETVHAKFSALQVIGVTALANITNSAVNAGKRIVSALGDSLINGGKNRALNIQNAKFQIEGLLGTEKYKEQWDRIDESINWAVKDTAYGYDSAARAASQFMASNVKVGEQMDYSLRAISGVAAMTNSTYDDIANVFTRVAGQGRVMAVDLNSLAARGMNAAATLGTALGKSESEIRDMVSKGKISFDMFVKAMDDAFGEHAKKGNETFEGALSNMKAAMSRIGAKVWDPLLTNQRDVFNQARLLINDLNNNYLNGPINTLNEKLTNIFQSLVKFFELGGVKNILLGIGNILGYISSIIKPVKDAFREIFPRKSVETLVSYTERFKEFTERLKLSEKTANNIKNTFKGVFSVMSTALSIIKSVIRGIGNILSTLTGIPGGILGVTGALGNWLTKMSEAIKASGIFTNLIEGISNVLVKCGNKFKEFCSHLDIFGGLVNGIKSVFTTLGRILKEFGRMLTEALRTGDLKAALDVFNTGVFSGILLNIKNITKQLQLFFGVANKQSVAKNLSLIISNIKDSLYALQFDIKADALMRIAKALLILAGALFVLSLIKPERLVVSLGAMALMMKELQWFMKALDEFTSKSFKDLGKLYIMVSAVSSLSKSLLILAVALRILGSMNIKQMATAIIGMGAALMIMCKVVKQLGTYEKDVIQSAKAIRKLSTSLLVLAIALKIMGSMDIKQMGVALLGMSVGLAAMTIAINKLLTYKKDDKIASMTKMAFSLILLGIALKILASIGWPNILTGLGAMGGALLILLGFVYALPKDLKELNAKVNALNMMALGLGFLGFILKDLGKMPWKNVATALVAMGGALTEILLFVRLLPKDFNVTGFVGLAFSILVLSAAMKVLGSLGVTGLAISLVALAGAFAILGLAGKLLEPLVPAILAVTAAMALFGAGMWLLGTGVVKLAAGIAALSAALTAGVTTIVAGISAIILGVAQLVPDLIRIFGDAIITLCQVIMTAAPMIAETVLVVIHETLKSMVEHGPEIVALLFQFVLGIIEQLKTYVPQLILAVVDFLGAIGEGIIKALKELDPSKVLPAVISIGLLVGIVMAMSALSSMIPQAALGILGFGVLIAELAAVLAAIGALSRIPGIKEIVADGGNFLMIIGTAIGQFVGGIIGGVGLGISNSMPQIATNLSEFMRNIEPFISGARLIDKSVLAGITMLSLAIFEITAANLIANIAKFLTFGSSFATLGQELSDFMNNAKDFLDGARNIKPESMVGFKYLADAIVSITAAGFLNSISKWIGLGTSSLTQFATELPAFGRGLKKFSKELEGVNTTLISEASKAASAIVELSNKIPNRDGLAQWFGGKKSLELFGGELKAFGKGLKEFSDSIVGLNVENMDKATEAADKLINLSNKVPSREGMGQWFSGKKSLKLFGGELEAFAKGLKSFSDEVAGLNIAVMDNATQAADKLIDLSNKVPNRAGMAQWFTGKKSLELFGGELHAFGEGLKSFSENVADLKVEPMNNAISAADKLVDLTNKVPNRAGMAQWFTGKKSLEIFGGELNAFGEGLKDFANALNGVNIENISKGAEAARGLADISNIIPNRAGLGNWFGGKKSLKIFGGELDALGEGLRDFADKTKNVKTENLSEVVGAVKVLAEATNELPNVKGKDLENRGWGFGSAIGHLANGIGFFCDKLKDSSFNVELVNNAVQAIKTLSETFNNLPDKDGGKIENRGWGLSESMKHFANGFREFMDKLSGVNVDPNYVTAVANSIKIMSEAVANLPDKDGGKIENRAWGLGMAMNHFAWGMGELLKSLNDNNYDADKLQSVASTLKTMAEAIGALPDKDGGKIENRAWGLGMAMTHFAWGLGELSKSVNENNYDADKIENVAQSIKLMAEAVGALPDKDGGKIENRAWGLGKAMTHFAWGLGELLKTINDNPFDENQVNSAANVVKNFADTFNSLPDKDGGTIENRAWGLGMAISHFGNGLGYFIWQMNNNSFDAAKISSAVDIVRQFGEIFNSIPDKDGGTIENRGWGLGSAIGHFGNGLNAFCEATKDSSFDKVSEGIGYLKNFIDLIPSIPENAGTNLANFAAGMDSLTPKLKGFVDSIKEIDFSNIDTSFDNIKKLLESLGSLSDFNLDNINTIGEAIKSITDSLTNLSNIPPDVTEKFKASLKSLGDEGITSFLDAFSKLPTEMKTKGGEAVTNFKDGVNDNKQIAVDALKDLHDKCKEQIKTDDYNEIGRHIVEGLRDGINSNSKLATDAMSALTTKLEQQARADLQINSPSKLFRKIGSGIPEGFAQGITMFKTSITNSIHRMSDSAISSTQKVISRITDIINSDIDSQMTLRPVLDLSEVEAGANRIGSLFNAPSLAVASNIGAISTGMSNTNQNGNADVVSAINRLSRNLGNTSGDTYNINGITYDDGSEVQEAVSTLVRAARIERRR